MWKENVRLEKEKREVIRGYLLWIEKVRWECEV